MGRKNSYCSAAAVGHGSDGSMACVSDVCPALLRGALHGPSHTIELNGLGRPGPGGIGFTSITATITTPPGPCSPDSAPSIYRASLGKGRIGWKLNLSSLFGSALLNADLSLQSDSLAVQPESGQFVFTDRNPALSATLAVALQRGAAQP